MVFAILELLLIWWPISAVLLVGVSWWLARRPQSWRRHAAMLLLILLAPLLLLLEGLASGCAIRPQGERCYWFGFGLTVAMLTIVPASAVLVGIGASCARCRRLG